MNAVVRPKVDFLHRDYSQYREYPTVDIPCIGIPTVDIPKVVASAVSYLIVLYIHPSCLALVAIVTGASQQIISISAVAGCHNIALRARHAALEGLVQVWG
jgi:hypothetical protein